RGQGSNNWVVAGSRTASGAPLLANDPHLLVQQPGSWFELHLRAPGYEVRGVAFPFLPGILVGVTPHHAWGITNVTGDVQDLYEERLNDDGTAAEHAGVWEPLGVVREEIAVRGAEPVAFDVRSSRHGPLLEVATIGVAPVGFAPLDRAYALRWTATDGLLEPSSLIDIASAPDFPTFRNALGALSCPGQNVVYADVDGAIGYQLTGRYPIRASGDGTVPVPGWTAQHEWEGWIAFDELPWSRDPERAYLVTANHRVYGDAFPHVIGHDMHAPHRAGRIAEILERDEHATVEASARLQVDTVSLAARRLLPSLTTLAGRDDDERWALGELSGWDGDLSARSRAAALYNAWIATIGSALFPGHDATADRYLAWREPFVCAALPVMLDTAGAPAWAGGISLDQLLLDALRDAISWLTDTLGEDRSGWRWGALHRVRFAHVLARMPGMDAVFVAGEHELGGDEQTVLQAGFDARHGFEPVVIPSYRVIVDLADVDATRAVVPTGGSGHPSSPHWNDQTDLWIAGELREAPVTRTAVEAATTSVLTLLPE
ncbi:MAG TPA: penicillin acylase family protein, partial [Actinomycetota bacterium]|nr:penicillin acylase family protein [Actinomycetota bacterium]